jgi:DNA-binding MarR family transcriptional regulator
VTTNQAPLALLLLRASRWFDRQVITELERQGWPRLTPAQTLVFAHLDAAGTSPSELARRLGATRQATADQLRILERLGLLTLDQDPTRARGRLVRLTPRGQSLASHARDLLAALEGALAAEAVSTLRRELLALDLPDDPLEAP